ncbi:3-deoxy-manno-octulosonate cytidylyltransferase [Candidatus Pelagibacter sp.]|uniref:3-deoxy-manno-octulosonate cytidylyltransferase n=1 Tax=Candidatus Pelagibacter sp. TaxID=2024849 RepID=UPI003F858DF4
MKTSIIIPARYGSSRYRGKPLVKILGREMILRVADICKKIKNVRVFIATDSKKIANVAEKNGYDYIMTSKNCLTGTDRVAEASKKIKSEIFINVQGDEPTISPRDIQKIINTKKKFPNHVICGYDKIHNFESPKNINLPKVVVNSKDELIYISRALVPGTKKKNQNINYFKQVCIYAFNKKQLKKFHLKKRKSIIEKIEDIEILRFFDLDEKIKMVKLNSNSVAVDEMCDVKKAEKLLKKRLK